MSRTPSLGRSDDSAVDMTSSPATPSDLSPFMAGQTYAIPPVEMASLPSRAETPQSDVHSALPDIMDPNTAANVPIRHVCCIGAGYVGGPTASVIALHNPNVRVTVVDRDERRIRAWRSRHLPIHEPGLNNIVRVARDGLKARQKSVMDSTVTTQDALQERRLNLFFSTECTETIANADMVLISVNTPTKMRGVGAGRATDMTALEGAVRDVAMHARPGTILVEKSTVPCKTGQLIKDILEAYRPGIVFPVLSNPEFLSEGTAVRDLMQSERVIIGCESTISGHRAASALVNLYAAWVPRARIAPINIWSSELCKLTANAMLAQRISSINSISAICEKTGADVSEIAKSIGMDPRIGPQFLKAGLGFGGSCFRKDIASLTYLAESLGLPQVAVYWQQVLAMNDLQRDRFARQVIAALNNSLRGKKIAVLGYAFKKNTGDARESPALDVVRLLLEEGPRSISIFDPLCSEADVKRELRVLEGGDEATLFKPSGPVEIVSDPYEACSDSSAILVLTDWDMFKIDKVKGPSSANRSTIGKSTYETASVFVDDCVHGATPTSFFAAPNDGTSQALPEIKATKDTSNMRRQEPITSQQNDTSSLLPADLLARLVPEPPCPADCTDCTDDATSSGKSEEKDTATPLDWQRISRSVREPRWVFDGRGILDGRAMAAAGFRLETLGKASIY